MKRTLGCVLLMMLCWQNPVLGATFNNPQVEGYGLDYCREWASNCGLPAAHAFCRSKGFSKASTYRYTTDNQKTRVIHGGQVCDAPYCDRITQVVCQPRARTFINPLVGGYGLDYCREWASNCGMPAAKSFCRSKGYSRAIDFHYLKDNQKTRVINGGQVCDALYCDRIDKVVCQ